MKISNALNFPGNCIYNGSHIIENSKKQYEYIYYETYFRFEDIINKSKNPLRIVKKSDLSKTEEVYFIHNEIKKLVMKRKYLDPIFEVFSFENGFIIYTSGYNSKHGEEIYLDLTGNILKKQKIKENELLNNEVMYKYLCRLKKEYDKFKLEYIDLSEINKLNFNWAENKKYISLNDSNEYNKYFMKMSFPEKIQKLEINLFNDYENLKLKLFELEKQEIRYKLKEMNLKVDSIEIEELIFKKGLDYELELFHLKMKYFDLSKHSDKKEENSFKLFSEFYSLIKKINYDEDFILKYLEIFQKYYLDKDFSILYYLDNNFNDISFDSKKYNLIKNEIKLIKKKVKYYNTRKLFYKSGISVLYNEKEYLLEDYVKLILENEGLIVVDTIEIKFQEEEEIHLNYFLKYLLNKTNDDLNLKNLNYEVLFFLAKFKKGMPDLFAYNPQNNEYSFVEVKSEKDQLNKNQKNWYLEFKNLNSKINYIVYKISNLK